MRLLLLPIALLCGCASQPASVADRWVSYRSGNGETISFEHHAGTPDEEGRAVCNGDYCEVMPYCARDGFYCVQLLGTPLLAIPKDVWTTLPRTIECGEQDLGWTFGSFRYEAWIPSTARAHCTAELRRTIRVLGRELEAIRVTVFSATDRERKDVLASFLYSPAHGVVAIDHPFAGCDDDSSFRTYWLEGSFGVLHPEVEK